MNNGKNALPSAQQPYQPSPDFVAFALYYYLGPDRDRITTPDFGARLWEPLMAATATILQETPLLPVCSPISALIKLLLHDDITEYMDPDREAGARLQQFHDGLHNDEQRLAALEKLQRGQGLSRLPHQSPCQILADFGSFLNKRLA